VENSIKILQTQAEILDGLGQPRSPWAVIEIHGKLTGAARLVQAIRNPETIRSHWLWRMMNTPTVPGRFFEVCQAAGVPMVLTPIITYATRANEL